MALESLPELAQGCVQFTISWELALASSITLAQIYQDGERSQQTAKLKTACHRATEGPHVLYMQRNYACAVSTHSHNDRQRWALSALSGVLGNEPRPERVPSSALPLSYIPQSITGFIFR